MVGPLYVAIGRWFSSRISAGCIRSFEPRFEGECPKSGRMGRFDRNCRADCELSGPEVHGDKLASYVRELRIVEPYCRRTVAWDRPVSEVRQSADFVLLWIHQLRSVSDSRADFQSLQRCDD